MIHVKYDIVGNHNRIVIGKDAYIADTTFYIRGDGHEIVVGDGCRYYGGDFWLEDTGCRITLGEGTTVMSAHLCAQENGSSITLGRDCMLSNNIIVRTSDSHSVVDRATGSRINPAQDVNIGDHVWIGAWARILKGVHVGDHSVVALGSIVTKNVEAGCIVAGNPAKVVRENVTWDREKH